MTRLASQIHKQFEIRIGLQELFALPILEEQARLIARAGKSSFASILPIPIQSGYTLSSSQHRLWILSQSREGNIAYNMPAAYVFEGSLDIEALESAFSAIIERHESLRTVFRKDDQGEPRQYILLPATAAFRIAYQDLRPGQERLNEAIREDFSKPFDLGNGPLLRAGLYQVTDNKWIFTYVVHHIISDGWSMDILIKELIILYKAYSKGETSPFSPLRIQYKDYAAWQREQLRGEALEEQKSYWLRQFEGELPVLELPGDKTRPAVKTYSGGVVTRVLDARL